MGKELLPMPFGRQVQIALVTGATHSQTYAQLLMTAGADSARDRSNAQPNLCPITNYQCPMPNAQL